MTVSENLRCLIHYVVITPHPLTDADLGISSSRVLYMLTGCAVDLLLSETCFPFLSCRLMYAITRRLDALTLLPFIQ